jgi:hypothetical protein
MSQLRPPVKASDGMVVDQFAETSTTKDTKVHEGKAGEQRSLWQFGFLVVQDFEDASSK